MAGSFSHFARVNFAPPKYLVLPTAGIDVSVSGVKGVVLAERSHGLELVAFAEEKLPTGAFTAAEITDPAAIVTAITALSKRLGVRTANIALPESRTYLFEADVEGNTPNAWATSVESRIDEFVPLPPSEVAFDLVTAGKKDAQTHIVGVGYARRVIAQSLAVFDDAGITVRSVESELFSMPRAVLADGDRSTVLIIDIGKTTTKLIVVSNRLPRYATTLDIGGHALTLAVVKYFGVSEEEARRVKVERGLVAGGAKDEYRDAMLSTVAAIREEITRRLEYWQTRAAPGTDHEPVTRAIIVGGNASVKGLPEYLAAGLKIPVELGDVFTNLASRDRWLPPVEYTQSLAYATAIGLALRQYVP